MQAITQRDLEDIIHDLHIAGVTLPIATNMEFKYKARGIWATITTSKEDEVVVQDSIRKTLMMFLPWPLKQQTFSYSEPLLCDVGLASHSIADAVLHELFGKFTEVLGCDTEINGAVVNAFCEELLLRWVLPEEAEISDDVAKVYMDSRRMAKVILMLRDPCIRPDTEVVVFKDAKLTDEAALQTTATACVFSMWPSYP